MVSKATNKNNVHLKKNYSLDNFHIFMMMGKEMDNPDKTMNDKIKQKT